MAGSAPPAPPTLALWLTRALAEATQRDSSEASGGLAENDNTATATTGGPHNTDLHMHNDMDKTEDKDIMTGYADVETQAQGERNFISNAKENENELVSSAEEHAEANAAMEKGDVDVRASGEEVRSSQVEQQKQPKVKEVRMQTQLHVDVRKKRTEIETEEQRLKSQADTARWDRLRARRHSAPGRHSSGPQRSAGTIESDEDEGDAIEGEGDERTPLAPVGPERHKRKRRRRKRHRKPNRNAAGSSSTGQNATPSQAAPVPTISFSSGMSAQEAGVSAPRRPPPAKPYYDTYPFTVVEETIWQGTTWPAGILSPIFRASTHWFITNKRIDYVMGFGGRIAESVELRRIVELRYERDCIDFMLCGRGTIVIILDEYSPVEELQISAWGLKKPFQKLRSVWLAARVDQERPIGRLTRDEEDELIRRKLSQAGVVHSAFEDAFAAADDLERARMRSESSHGDITSSAPPTPASSF